MYRLMRRGAQETAEPPRPVQTPAAPPGASRAGREERPADQDDWPLDVHLPDEKEDDEC